VRFSSPGYLLRRKTRTKAPNKPKAADRPLALTEDEESAVIHLIMDGNSSGSYVTQRDVLNFVESQFQKCLTYRWVEYFLQPHADIVCKTTLVPQENPQLQVPKQLLDDYVKHIKEYVSLVPTESIFNIDECGVLQLNAKSRIRCFNGRPSQRF
jgi:hypothetical protein